MRWRQEGLDSKEIMQTLEESFGRRRHLFNGDIDDLVSDTSRPESPGHYFWIKYFGPKAQSKTLGGALAGTLDGGKDDYQHDLDQSQSHANTSVLYESPGTASFSRRQSGLLTGFPSLPSIGPSQAITSGEEFWPYSPMPRQSRTPLDHLNPPLSSWSASNNPLRPITERSPSPSNATFPVQRPESIQATTCPFAKYLPIDLSPVDTRLPPPTQTFSEDRLEEVDRFVEDVRTRRVTVDPVTRNVRR